MKDIEKTTPSLRKKTSRGAEHMGKDIIRRDSDLYKGEHLILERSQYTAKIYLYEASF